MTPERYQQIKALFHAALEHEPGAQAAFLDQACAGDPALRAEVEALLAVEPAPSFIEGAIQDAVARIAADPPEPVQGQRIGPYQVIRQIARGGMGAVYLALRADDQYRKQVAIKLIRRGLDTEDIIRRFRNERQILAGLDHPNVARLLDGGATDDGRPYLVMEYIEGQPIDDYADHHTLSTEDRLRLFRQVCAAVQYAHQHLVIHRDIKPSNILVTEDGTPKLLDFGIAKLLTPEMAAQTLDATAPALRLMTPEYASPEQVRGETITTASDVYSLGVVLYELLTGHRPYRLTGRTPHEVLQAVCEQEPERPSTAITRVEEVATDGETKRITPEVVSEMRADTPERLRRRLSGDLDTIVLKAMHKEPQRRYASVEQFSEDIRRHLEGLPVIARKDTLGYRAGKFVRRHKVGALATALIVVTLMGGIAATLWQARVAERRFNDVRQLANTFMFDIHDEIANLPGSTRAREKLVMTALQYLDRLAQESGGEASLQRELATAYEKVGDIQGNPYQPNLGDTTGALQSYRKALAIREALLAADPQRLEARLDVAASQSKIGDMLLSTHDLAGALERYRRANQIYEEVAVQQPGDMRIRSALAASYESISEALWERGETASGFETYRQALQIREAIVTQEPGSAPAQHGLARSLDTFATRLVYTEAKAEAVAHMRRSVTILESLTAADPTNARLRRNLATGYTHLGDVLWGTGDVRGELESYRQSLAIHQELAAADPANIQLRRDLGVAHGNVGYALAQTGEASGLEHCQKAVAIFESLTAADPASIKAKRDLAAYGKWTGDAGVFLADDKRAPVSTRIERWQHARASYQRSLAIMLDLRDRGLVRGDDVGGIDQAQAGIIKCDAALAKLRKQ
jgi:non-specific serine/threonine protein kinase/serine/threonine-protein kinase